MGQDVTVEYYNAITVGVDSERGIAAFHFSDLTWDEAYNSTLFIAKWLEAHSIEVVVKSYTRRTFKIQVDREAQVMIKLAFITYKDDIQDDYMAARSPF